MLFLFPVKRIQITFSYNLVHWSLDFPGSDPANQLIRFAKELRGSAVHLDMISLGRGQGPKAEELIAKAQILKGRWIFLQNCHLAASWMPKLQAIVEGWVLQTMSNPVNIFPRLFQMRAILLSLFEFLTARLVTLYRWFAHFTNFMRIIVDITNLNYTKDCEIIQIFLAWFFSLFNRTTVLSDMSFWSRLFNMFFHSIFPLHFFSLSILHIFDSFRQVPTA